MTIIDSLKKRLHRRFVHEYTKISQKGALGRCRQAFSYLGEKYRKLPHNADWEAEVNHINNIYTGIRVWWIPCAARLGEYLPRYLMLMRFIEETPDNYLNIMYDSDYKYGNKALAKIIDRKVPVVCDDNKEKWIYLLSKVHNIDYSKYFTLTNRCWEKRVYSYNWCKDRLNLSETEIEYCKEKMRKMNLQEPYVTFFNRDSSFLAVTMPTVNTSYHDYRDSQIKTRYLMIDYLNEKNLKPVRVGKSSLEKCTYAGCIDYAFDYRDELMDVYIHSKAKFVVADGTGLALVPLITNGHLVFTNWVPFFANYMGFPDMFDGIMILKKLFDFKHNRYLTFMEMIDADAMANFNAYKYKEMGLRYIENTSQEILDAVIEMNERIDGTWVEPEDNKYRQEKFKDCVKKAVKKHGLFETNYLHVRIGSKFLADNWDILGL